MSGGAEKGQVVTSGGMNPERRNLRSEKLNLALFRAQYVTGVVICFTGAVWVLLAPGF